MVGDSPSPSVSYASPPTGPFGEQKNTAETEYYGVDASLLWKPIDNLAINQTNIYQSSSMNGLPMGDFTANNQTNYRHFDIPEGTLDRYWLNGLTIDYTIPQVGTITSASDWLNRHTGDWEDISEFTSAIWGTPLYPSPVPQYGDWHIFNQELRFASAWQFPLQFVGGLFYDKTQFVNSFSQVLPQFLDIFGTPEAAYAWNPETQEEKAIFGELTYDITSRWSATLGGRYSEDTAKNYGYQWGAIVGTTSSADKVPMDTYEADKVFTPKFLVKYQANQNLDVYADAAKGFRPGGGQIPPSILFCAAQYAALDLTPAELSTYKPDSVWSYELGEKLISDDHRYSLNSSLYWINWSDIRELLGLDCGYAALVNSGDARSIGAELQVSAVPIDHVTLSGGIGYDNARILHPGVLSGTSPAGTPIQEVAPLTANLMAQYQAPLTATLQWLAEGDYSYTGHSITVTTDPYGIIRPAYALVNMRLELIDAGTQYAFFIKNVGDVHPNLSEGFSIGGFDPGRLRWIEGVPRTYGIEVSQRF